MIFVMVYILYPGDFMRFYFSVILFMLNIYSLYSSDVTGRVISSLNGAPLIGANVYLEDTNYGTATDGRGIFVMNDVPPGSYTINVTYVGYKLTENIEVIVNADEKVNCTLELEEDIYDLNDIVVTGTRTRRLIKDSPVATEVIHADEIENLGAENVGEVLEERAGIIITQDGARGGLLSAQLQGLNDNHTLVLVDGAPIIGRIAGKLDLSRISVQNIDRIEIVKGAASSLYGSEAVGGVINIITKDPEEALTYSGNFNLGSFEARNAKGDFSVARNKTSLLFSTEAHRADGYDLDPSTENTTSDDYNNFSIFSKIKYKSSETYALQANGQFFSQRQHGFDGGERTTDTRSWYVNVNNQWDLNNHSSFKFRLYHTSYTKEIDRADVYVENIESLSRGEFIYNRVLLNHILTAGGERSYNLLQSNRLESGEKSVNNFSFYIQDEIFYQWIEFNLGIRADFHSEFNWYYSPKIGFLLKPNDTFRVRGSYSYGFRAPDFIELYLDLDHSGLSSQPYVAYGNSRLQPETSRSLNLGFEYHYSAQTILKVNLFQNHLDNMINSLFLYQNTDGIQYYTYENLAEAKTEGFEFDGIVKFWNNYRLTGGYTYTETFDLARDEPFFNRPKHSARVKFDWNYSNLGFSGNLRWRYIGKRLFINLQGEQTTAPWYATWNTRLRQTIYQPFSVYFEVTNLFDYQNRNFVALPGRLIFVGIELN
jgi:outer membrane receptor for ferrienterochelin and colicins